MGRSMPAPAFPIANVNLDGLSPSDAIDLFLKARKDDRWVLLGDHAPQSFDQLWTAWIQATRNELRGSMVARSVDAEFLRYLAGTHHISEAFARAGIQDGQGSAWVACLPAAVGEANDLGHLQPKSEGDGRFEVDLQSLLASLGWALIESEISCSIEGCETLGIDLNGWSEKRRFESVIAHVLMADDQSSSHR